MLISPIANKTAISKIQSNNTENKEFSSQKAVTTLPAFADAKSLVNINFKAAIHDYAAEGNWKGVEKELQKVNVNAQDVHGETALMLAITHNRMNVAEKLLQNPDIDINAQSPLGYTALMYAVNRDNAKMVEKLINHPDINVNQQNRTGYTALSLASFNVFPDVVEKILQHPDVDVKLKNNVGTSALDYSDKTIKKMIKEYKRGVDRREGVNKTQTSNPVSDINAKDKDGNTALIRACGDCEDTETVKILLQNPNIDVNAKNRTGNTALIWASYKGNTDAVEKLLQRTDIDVNVQNVGGNTALHLASFYGQTETVKKLLQHPNIDVNLRVSNGKTALDFANVEVAQMIEDYVPGVDRREGVIKAEKTKQIDVEKLTSFKEIWSDEEKQSIAKMVEDKDYDGLAKVFESKGTELNGKYEQLINDINSIKEAAEKSARKTETEKIREEEKIAAEEKVSNKMAELDKSKAEYEEKNKALDNLINDYQSMLADDVEAAKSGIRTLYGIKSNELPEKMDLGEQMIYVIDIMSNNRNKLSNMNSDSPEKITKALQDNNGQISADGLKFLERVIKVSDRSCSEDDLISSINAVKDKSRHIDMKKVSYFIANLSWGQSRISDVIQKVEQYNN